MRFHANSDAKLKVSAARIPIAAGLSLDPAEIAISYIRASGPGGQNVNKVATAAQLRFDLRNSPSLPEPVKSRAAPLAGTRLTQSGEIVITADRHRTQSLNRDDAVARLVALLAAATVPAQATAQDQAHPRQQAAPARGQGEARRGEAAAERHDRGRLGHARLRRATLAAPPPASVLAARSPGNAIRREMDNSARPIRHPLSLLRGFLVSEAAGGIVLMLAAALALVVANSPLAHTYFETLHVKLGPLTLSHWINDGLMALFFLLVGLEIKREMLDGQLATWPRRALPGIAAAGGMAVPALIYLAFNVQNGEVLRGWAIPTATDIAFALGVLSLLGKRVPPSLKIFLAALAIIDDLGAVLIIALFYTTGLSLIDLAGAAAVLVALFVLNRRGVLALWPYLILGIVLWVLVYRSGIHATLAGVALALTIPLRMAPGRIDDLTRSPLHRLEHGLESIVPFVIVPIFGFANAGVSFAGIGPSALVEPLTLGIAAGLVVGKLIGVFGSAALTIRVGLADLPAEASWPQLLGVALLCGIGFTMSLFIGLLAFADNEVLQNEVKLGIICGSVLAAILGSIVLLLSSRQRRSP